ncbi:MAG: BrnA antitoxin family protein [Gammaproteobacteria bacterium]
MSHLTGSALGVICGIAFREMLGKKQVNMLLDRRVIEYFKGKAGRRGYQTLINETLKQAIDRETLEETLRRVLREELRGGKAP